MTTPSPKRRTRGQGEGSIYQRASDGKWVAVVNLGWRNGKRERKYLYGATRDEVAKKLTKALGDRDRGVKINPERQTVQQFLDRWHAEVIVPDRRPKTVRTYRNAIDRHLVPELGHKQLSRLTAQDVQAMIASRHALGLRPETIASILSVLRLALSQAERWDLVPRNVARLVDRPRVEPFDSSPLTPSEARTLLEHLAADRLSALYAVSVKIGLRQAEAMGLRWHDLDLENGILGVRHQLQRVDRQWVFVPPKTKRSRRTIELPQSLVDALRTHQERQAVERAAAGSHWQEWRLVFCRDNGAPLDPRTLGELLHEALADAGIAKRRWHDLRHTAVTLMLAAGVLERVIMEIMGHSHLDMTRLYGRVLPLARRDAITRVDDLLADAEHEPKNGREEPSQGQWLQSLATDGIEAKAPPVQNGRNDAKNGRSTITETPKSHTRQ